MSGTFNDIDVPPTLTSFAVDVASYKDIITPELKAAGNKLVKFTIARDEYELPVYEKVMEVYENIAHAIKAKAIVSAYVTDAYGIAPALSKMAFGNKLGIKLDNVSVDELFAVEFGNIVAEVPVDQLDKLEGEYTVIGEVTNDGKFTFNDIVITVDEAISAWTRKLEKVFPTSSKVEQSEIKTGVFKTDSIYICKNKIAKPTVFIPVFPGTNCEYDSTKAFELAGANVITKVFKNLNADDIRDSVKEFEESINKSQIIMFPGGFSAGDEADGSAKFFATAFRNEKIKEAVNKLIKERDGLALGICNGFQALIKLGLVPYGEIMEQTSDSPTLTMNNIGRHISKMVYIKVVTNNSPWLQKTELGATYCNPASHGEGRFVANDAWIKKLFENGQVATQYVDEFGNPTMNEEWNPNGSYAAIEGITSPDGRILGKMAHAERRGEAVAMNIYGEQDMKLFEAGVEYFK
jgi:phosphoribosylformylglycinamidine synthase